MAFIDDERYSFKEHGEDSQKRAQKDALNPDYWNDKTGLQPRYYVERSFPEYHADIIATLAANGVVAHPGSIAPLEDSEVNQVIHLTNKGAEHAALAVTHHNSGRYADAHSRLLAAAASYDSAAQVLYGASARNHGLFKMPGNSLGNMFGRGKPTGQTIAGAYNQSLKFQGEG